MEPVLTLPRGRAMTVDDLHAIPWAGAKFELIDGCLVITPEHTPFSFADVDALPDDGWKHELIGGALVMSPSPVPQHQRLVTALWRVLADAAPSDLEVFVAPLDVRFRNRVGEPDESFQPDVLVVRRDDVGQKSLTGTPLLAVEILSPSTSLFDRHLKRERYERADIASYWLVDPQRGHLTVLELREGTFVEIADTTDTFVATLPFAVTIDLADLVR